MLGLYEQMKPKFVKRYAELADEISKAVTSYRSDVESGKFPAEENTFHMDANEYDELLKELGAIKNE
jgi:3-methyl-2-oxobutanoate hydroxymethyltransferase